MKGRVIVEDTNRSLESLAAKSLESLAASELYKVLNESRNAANKALNRMYDIALDYLDEQDNVIYAKNKQIQELQIFLDEVSASNNIEENNNLERQATIDKLSSLLHELMQIVEIFGLKDIDRCGRTIACNFCEHFNEKINHATCEDDQFFKWKHKEEATSLVYRETLLNILNEKENNNG